VVKPMTCRNMVEIETEYPYFVRVRQRRVVHLNDEKFGMLYGNHIKRLDESQRFLYLFEGQWLTAE